MTVNLNRMVRTLRIGEVAKMLGVHTSTVKRIPRERLNWHRTEGDQRRYEPEDVAAYLRSQGRRLPKDLSDAVEEQRKEQ